MSSRKVLLTALGMFAAVLLVGCPDWGVPKQGVPILSITESPVYGDKEGVVRGRVDNTKGYNYWDLGVAVHIKVNEMWWGKPFENRLLTPLNPDFTFAVDVVTGGTDENATEILVCLVSAKYVPSVNTPPSPDEYFDRVLIIRQPTDGVTPPGDIHAPVAQDVTVSTAFQTPVAVTLVATDEDSDPLSYETGVPSHGKLSGTAPNLTYTPDAGFTGDDSFTYAASDGKAKSNVATVTIRVGQAQEPPPPPARYTLKVAVEGKGTVELSPQQESYESGSRVKLTALADGGYRFDSWDGDATGSVNPLEVVMEKNLSITARFAAIPPPPPPPPPVSFLDKLGAQKWINFAPIYFDPTKGQYPTEVQLREALQKMRDLGFTGVLFYESGQSGNVLKHAPRIAKEVGYEVIGVAIWNPLDTTEVQNAIDAKVYATFYIVGSEGLFRAKKEDYTKEQLKTALINVREQTKKAVTTAEPVSIWLENLDLIEAVDFVSANIYGFWEGQREPQAAVDFLAERYNALKAKAGTKRVIIRETGFPTGGHPDGSVAKQRDYFERLGKSGVPFVHFEAFDQPWKHEYLEGYDIGIHWGILDKDGKVKADNHAPVAQDVTVSTPFQTPVAVTLAATDEDGDPLSYETSLPSHGKLSGTAPNLTYTPDAGFTGDDSFTYTASDGKVKSNVATVIIHVGQAQNPTIEFTSVPPKGSFDNLKGKCTNVDYIEFRVVVYIKVPPEDKWWVKPYYNNPLTTIQPDGTWVCDITTGGKDETATEIRAFVVVKTYKAALNQLPKEGDYIASCAVTR